MQAYEPRKRFSILAIVVIVLGIIVASIAVISYFESIQANNEISSLQQTISSLQNNQNNLAQLENGSGTYPGTNFFTTNSSTPINPVTIYNYANASVVTVEGLQSVPNVFGQTSVDQVLGSGFVVKYSTAYYIVTNFHVVDGDTNISVTFSNGDGYAAKIVGTDPYSDLAVLSTNAPSSEYHPLAIAPSSSLKVGDSVLAIGNPFGLSGSMSVGIVSQLGRTIQESTAGNYAIANVIQISTPINPGNSGGPLFNSNGQVVGITTAIVSGSQGVGFAIPSDTILQEIELLISTGSYNLHPYLGIGTLDMSYDIANATGGNVTYGVLVETVVSGGPAANAGIVGGSQNKTIDGVQLLVGGDIIVSLNGTRILNSDALSSWLQEHALPGQVVEIGIYNSSGQYSAKQVTLGTRPPA